MSRYAGPIARALVGSAAAAAARVAAFLATVTTVSGGLATVQDDDAATPDDEAIGRMAGFVPPVGAVGVVLRTPGGPILLGWLAEDAPAGYSLDADLEIATHLRFGGGNPDGTVGAAAGTGASVSTAGSDGAFRVVLVTGTSPSGSGILFTLTWATPWSSSEYEVVCESSDSDSAAAETAVYVDDLSRSTTAVDVKTRAALAASTSYRWMCHASEGV